MKMRIASLSLLALCLTWLPFLLWLRTYMTTVPSMDRIWAGPGSDFGFSLSDSFTVGSPANISGASFWAWLIPGDTLTSVEFRIGAAQFGNELMGQTLNVTAANCFSNQSAITFAMKPRASTGVV